jgi:hypothetical protein
MRAGTYRVGDRGLISALTSWPSGSTWGLTHLPTVAVVVVVALQALVAAQLGLAGGTKMDERWRECAEQVAGTALILLGIYVITGELVST